MSGSCEKALTVKVPYLTEKLSSVRVNYTNPCTDLVELTKQVQWMKKDIGKSLSTVSTEMQMT